MSEADYLSSIDTYWADEYFAERERMSETSKPNKEKKQTGNKSKKRAPEGLK